MQSLCLVPMVPFTQALGPGLSGLPSDPQSLGEMQQQLQKTLTSPAEAAGFLQGSRDSGGSSKDSSCDTDDFVMVPAQFPGQGATRQGWAGRSLQTCQTEPLRRGFWKFLPQISLARESELSPACRGASGAPAPRGELLPPPTPQSPVLGPSVPLATPAAGTSLTALAALRLPGRGHVGAGPGVRRATLSLSAWLCRGGEALYPATGSSRRAAGRWGPSGPGGGVRPRLGGVDTQPGVR